jgi:aminocarboxymuconate-semialdehyde decarboxylase
MVVIIGGDSFLKVDAHTHILPAHFPDHFDIPLRLVPYDKLTDRGFGARLEYKENGQLFRELKPNCFDPDVILQDCDSFGVDVQVLCTVPVMFNYHLPPATAIPWSQFLNDDLANVCNSKKTGREDRLIGLGTLPLQDTQASVAEVQRCLDMGLPGFQIGSHVNAYRGHDDVTDKPIIEQLPLNHASLMPVWEECEKRGACIMVHPWDMQWWCNNDYWLPWLVGMPTETTLAGTTLILGGVLSKFPKLRIMLAHGGGALPFLLGRIDWGYKCRPDLVAKDLASISASMDTSTSESNGYEVLPSSKLSSLYFDSITHDEEMLQILIKRAGVDKVMLGSDYPFPLGEVPSVAPVTGEHLSVYPGHLIESSSIPSQDKKQLLALSALEWMNIDATRFDSLLQRYDSSQKDDRPSKRVKYITEDANRDLQMFVVDAFTDKPYAGNPAAVVVLSSQQYLDLQNFNSADKDMAFKKISEQMNLSETAFVVPVKADAHLPLSQVRRFQLRWFTPTGVEVNLCGHATLATSTVLFDEFHNSNSEITFSTLSGDLSVAKVVQGFEMTLPANPPVSDWADGPSPTFLTTVTSKINRIRQGEYSIAYSKATKKLLIRLLPKDDDVVEQLQYLRSTDFRGLGIVNKWRDLDSEGKAVRGIILTVDTSNLDDSISPYLFESRYFAPWVGIEEDPVTGSAHTVLAPYYTEHFKDGNINMYARQCSPRGGDLYVRCSEDGQKVIIVGKSSVVTRGSIAMPR